MLRRFSLLMSLTLVVLVALVGFSGFGWLQPSAAQDDPPVRLDVGGINAEKFPTLTLLVNVWDEFDVPVSGLTVDDFQVTAGGAATSVLSVENITEDDLPISVVLVIDTSESMLGQPLDDAKAAALAFVDTLAPTDAVALVDFDSTVKVAVDFTTDRDVLRNAIENLRADGRTALYDAVYNAAELANESGNPRRFVVFLTDGNEYGGLSTQAGQAGVDLAVANNVPYYVFGLGYWLDEGYLNSLVRNSHGKVYLHPDSSTLAEAYAYLATFLRTQYVVTLDSGLEPDGRTVELAVTASGVTQTVEYTAPDLYPQTTFDGVPEEALAEPVTVTIQTTAPRGLGTQSVMLDGEPLAVTFAPAGDNAVSAEITLDPYAYAPGEHTLELSAVDAQGGARTASATFAVAAVPPVFEIVGLDEGAFISDPSFGVSVNVTQAQAGQVIERVEYRIDGQTVATATDAPYTADVDVLGTGAGNHTLAVVVVDANGETVVERPFTVDGALFITPSPTPTATFTPSNTPTFTPTATDEPTATDTEAPTVTDTDEPTVTDTDEPTVTDTDEPTATDTEAPTATDTDEPSAEPAATADLAATAEAMSLILTSTAEGWTDTPVPPTDTPEFTPTNTETPEATATATATTDLRATADAMSTSLAGTATMSAGLDLTAEQVTAAAMIVAETEAAAAATDTEEPTATDTEEATATDTEEPTATDTEEATATDTEEPMATDTEEATVTDTEDPTDEPTPESVDVDVDAEEGSSITDYWPIFLIALIVLIVIAFVVLNSGRRQRTQSGG